MKAIDRRIFLGGAGAAATLIASPYVSRAVAAEFNFKAGTNQIASHPNNVRLKEAFDRILAQSNGRLDIKLFPNSQLGGESDLLSQVRSGAVQIFTIGGLVISSVVPVAAINGTAFAFKDYEQVWRAMDGKLGAHIRQHLAKAGLYTPSRMWDLGFRQITVISIDNGRLWTKRGSVTNVSRNRLRALARSVHDDDRPGTPAYDSSEGTSTPNPSRANYSYLHDLAAFCQTAR